MVAICTYLKSSVRLSEVLTQYCPIIYRQSIRTTKYRRILSACLIFRNAVNSSVLPNALLSTQALHSSASLQSIPPCYRAFTFPLDELGDLPSGIQLSDLPSDFLVFLYMLANAGWHLNRISHIRRNFKGGRDENSL